MSERLGSGSREFADLREQVYAANRAIVEAGLVVLTFGNVSGADRDAGVVAIKPSGVSYTELGPNDIVIVDLETGAVVDGGRRPSSDTPTHLVLYRGFGTIGGVVHTHSRHAAGWAQARKPIPCLGTTHADHFRGSVPVTRQLADHELGDEYERYAGEAILETFAAEGLDPAQVPSVLIASHGPFTWGASISEAVENAVALETVAAIAAVTRAIDPFANEIGLTLRDRHFLRKHGPSAYYGQTR